MATSIIDLEAERTADSPLWEKQTRQLMLEVVALAEDAVEIGETAGDAHRILYQAQLLANRIVVGVDGVTRTRSETLDKIFDLQALLSGAAAVATRPGIRILAQHAAALLDRADAFLDVVEDIAVSA